MKPFQFLYNFFIKKEESKFAHSKFFNLRVFKYYFFDYNFDKTLKNNIINFIKRIKRNINYGI